MTIHNVQQGGEEWLALRLGRMTASHAQAIATQGKGLETLCRNLAYERFTGKRKASYKNEAMQLGNDDENYARQAYELETGRQITEVGFVQHNDFVGFSPDGLVVSERRGVEFKRQDQERHGDILLGAERFDSKYVWQSKMGILIMGYDVWSLCSYNPDFLHKSLFMLDITLDAESEDKLLGGFEKGEALIKANLERLLNS